MEWDKDALAKLNKAPFFIRKIARGKVEKAARAEGIDHITLEFMERIKNKEMGSQSPKD
jgi:Proto-chlorophyllide reductase 57 kD subunit.